MVPEGGYRTFLILAFLALITALQFAPVGPSRELTLNEMYAINALELGGTAFVIWFFWIRK